MTTTAEEDIDALLPRPPGVVRRWLNAHPVAVDVTIAVFYLIGVAGLTVLQAVVPIDGDGQPAEGLAGLFALPGMLLTVLRIAVALTALLLRRRFPLAGVIAISLTLLGDEGIAAAGNAVALCVLLYSVPVYRSVAAGWIGYGVAVATVAGTTAVSLATTPEGQRGPGDALFASTLSAALWFLVVLMTGVTIGNRRRYTAALIDRAHQLARERDQRARLAVAEERSRIAREMHDIVAHSVSVMIALSEGAARAAELAPEAAADAMRRSAETGRTALTEMRRLLGVLADPEEGGTELAPQPGIAQLPQLVEGFRAAGLDVHLRVEAPDGGDGAVDRAIDQGHDLAVHRIVQEGLTNALRYAGTGAHVEVSVESTAEGTVVAVRDFGPAGPLRPLTGLGSGRGIAGLAERVRMFGGEIDAGPVATGWLLRAVLPAPHRGEAEGRAGAQARADEEETL